MLAALGALGAIAGYGLGALGARKGARAMKLEAQRQANEQLAFDLSRFRPLGAYAASASPSTGLAPALASEQAAIGANAVQPAALSGGEALGVSSIHGLGPSFRAQNAAVSQGVMADQNALQEAQMDLALGEIERKRLMAQALYDARMARAAKTGQGMRRWGEILGTLGMAGMNYGMGQPSTASSTPTAENPNTRRVSGFTEY